MLELEERMAKLQKLLTFDEKSAKEFSEIQKIIETQTEEPINENKHKKFY